MECRDGCGTCDNAAPNKGTCVLPAANTACGGDDCIEAGTCAAGLCEGRIPKNEWGMCQGSLFGIGTCVGGKCDGTVGSPLGGGCTSASDCATNICSDDGFCCDGTCAGECDTCTSGTCAPKTAGELCLNGQCDGSSVCDTTLPGLKPDGEACVASANDCFSGNCSDDGFCCAVACTGDCNSCSGGNTCYALYDGAPCNDAPGGIAGLCDGQGTCAEAVLGKALGETCAVFGECASGFCSHDNVCCDMECRTGCGTCNFPGSPDNGKCVAEANGTACGGTDCKAAGQCLNAGCEGLTPKNDWQSCTTTTGGTGVCSGGNCDDSIGSALGATCSSAGDCATNICSDDGKCCDGACTGECNTCTTGSCAPAGTLVACATGFCDGSGACDNSVVLLPDGDVCTTGGDCTSGNCSGDGYCCATSCLGDCNSCSGGTCNVAFAGAACNDAPGGVAGLCDGAGACAAATVNLPLGAVCAAWGECASSYCSEDGFCCDQACGFGGCGTCSTGTCVHEPVDTVCGTATDCLSTGKCDANGQCPGNSKTQINDWAACTATGGGTGVCSGGTCYEGWGDPIGTSCSGGAIGGNGCATGTCAGVNGPGARYCCLNAYCDDTECCDCSSGEDTPINEGGACTANGGSICSSGSCI
jgi:hypothetical protein